MVDLKAGGLGGSMLFQIEREKGTGAEFDGGGYMQQIQSTNSDG
jgi:hypothetical protein